MAGEREVIVGNLRESAEKEDGEDLGKHFDGLWGYLWEKRCMKM